MDLHTFRTRVGSSQRILKFAILSLDPVYIERNDAHDVHDSVEFITRRPSNYVQSP